MNKVTLFIDSFSCATNDERVLTGYLNGSLECRTCASCNLANLMCSTKVSLCLNIFSQSIFFIVNGN